MVSQTGVIQLLFEVACSREAGLDSPRLLRTVGRLTFRKKWAHANKNWSSQERASRLEAFLEDVE